MKFVYFLREIKTTFYECAEGENRLKHFSTWLKITFRGVYAGSIFRMVLPADRQMKENVDEHDGTLASRSTNRKLRSRKGPSTSVNQKKGLRELISALSGVMLMLNFVSCLFVLEWCYHAVNLFSGYSIVFWYLRQVLINADTLC